MTDVGRRTLVAAGATLAAGLVPRKPRAEAAGPLARMMPGRPGPLPAVQVTLADGVVKPLSEYAGRGLVLNLWATWCAPCVAEMPALDALAGLVGPGIVVLPLSSDRGGAAAVSRFYRERGVKHLPLALDPGGAGARALGVRGLPTTLLIDPSGQERGRLEGAAEWADPDAVAAIRRLIGQPAPA